MCADLNSQLSEWLRSQQSPNLRYNWAIESTDNDSVPLTQNSIRKNDVNCRAQAFDNFDLENGALELRQVHKSVAHPLLSEVDEKHDHVGNSLSRDR